MKAKLFLVLSIVVMTTMGFECINDPITVTVNADLLTGCFKINPGNGSFNDSTTTINIGNLIPSDYRDKLKKIRIYDIRIRVSEPHPNGIVTGSAYYRFIGEPSRRLCGFSGQYEAFSQGVSVLNSGGLITPDPAGFPLLVQKLQNASTILTQSVVLRGQGTGPVVTQQLTLCVDIYLQVEGEAS
jgi:hypothetical protein